MLRGFIFDMDGVLVDSHPVHKRAWAALFTQLGRDFTPEQLEFVVEGSRRDDILRHFLGDLTEAELQHYGLLKESLFREQVQSVSTIKGVPQFLVEVEKAGYSKAVASSASRQRALFMLSILKLEHRFQAIVTGDDVHRGKPDPMVFQVAAERLAMAQDEVLVFEDATGGVRAAKAAGMKVVALGDDKRHARLKDAGADAVFRDFTAFGLNEITQLFAKD